MNPAIYFDYNATTRVCDEAIEAFQNAIGAFANPSSSYRLAQTANAYLEKARSQIAQLIGAKSDEIFFTSGATESNNWAIKGAFFARCSKKMIAEGARIHWLVSQIEHSSVLEALSFLERFFPIEISQIAPNREGLISPESVLASLKPNTQGVCVMLANNEVGTIQPIQAISLILRERGIYFHVDGVQAIGKIPLDVSQLGADTMSFSAHKFHGIKGAGGLYVRSSLPFALEPLIHGGGQEQSKRGGTQAVALIAAMGEAAHVARENLHDSMTQTSQHRQMLIQELSKAIPAIRFNGLLSCLSDLNLKNDLNNDSINHALQNTLSNTLSIQIKGVRAEALAAMLDQMDNIQVSLGSACSNNKQSHDALSHVLLAMGLSQDEIQSTLRISFGRFTQTSDITQLIDALQNNLRVLQRVGR